MTLKKRGQTRALLRRLTLFIERHKRKAAGIKKRRIATYVMLNLVSQNQEILGYIGYQTGHYECFPDWSC